MKTKMAITAIALAGVFPMVAAAQSLQTASPAAVTAKTAIQKQTPRIITPFSTSVPTKQGKIERYGKFGKTSSQPWTQMVGWHPGRSAFPTGEDHESQLQLVSIRF